MHCLRVSDGREEWKANLPNSETVQRWYIKDNEHSIVAVGITPGKMGYNLLNDNIS